MTWRKSSHSGGNGGGCIEVGAGAGRRVLVRDTKNRTGPVLAFTARNWQQFTRQLKAGAHYS